MDIIQANVKIKFMDIANNTFYFNDLIYDLYQYAFYRDLNVLDAPNNVPANPKHTNDFLNE